jgi:pimeloyl-ACP methyl ester carboxylesterase
MRTTRLTLTATALWLTGAAPLQPAAEPAPHHLVYLHGRIVQVQQDSRPRHPEHGDYELEQILGTFRDRGFVVHDGIRPKDASVSESADRLVGKLRKLHESGVSTDHITVVGASMGAGIALLASARLQDPEARFVLLGLCLSDGARQVNRAEGAAPSGKFLSVRESSDELTRPCAPWHDKSEPGTSKISAREIVLDTGLRHGFLYRPLPEWVDPLVAWATGEDSMLTASPRE